MCPERGPISPAAQVPCQPVWHLHRGLGRWCSGASEVPSLGTPIRHPRRHAQDTPWRERRPLSGWAPPEADPQLCLHHRGFKSLGLGSSSQPRTPGPVLVSPHHSQQVRPAHLRGTRSSPASSHQTSGSPRCPCRRTEESRGPKAASLPRWARCAAAPRRWDAARAPARPGGLRPPACAAPPARRFVFPAGRPSRPRTE